ncbi:MULTISPECIES: hypothetical protein [Nocardiopsis]|uniref:hypothetical protein n=1 Tax=Nocardiopsis TaxID=2013 RepID=UPI00034C6868|nr:MULTISPECIES: hypothetical protein [Nocardiopsis]
MRDAEAPLSLFPDTGADHLAARLHGRRSALVGVNATVGGSDVVHALEDLHRLGVLVAVPACGAAPDPMRLRRSTAPVTCRRCLRLQGPLRVPEGQLPIPGLPL